MEAGQQQSQNHQSEIQIKFDTFGQVSAAVASDSKIGTNTNNHLRGSVVRSSLHKVSKGGKDSSSMVHPKGSRLKRSAQSPELTKQKS